MSAVVIVAKDNAYGLSRHSAILAEALARAGHVVRCATPDSRGLLAWASRKRAGDVIIHLERVSRRWLGAGRINLLMPMQERFPQRLVAGLRRIDAVLANTREAERIFRGLGARTLYVGFSSRDRRIAGAAQDWSRFFHLAGASTLKGTEDILALWRLHPEWPELVLVQKSQNATSSPPANVRILARYVEDEELRGLQNACGVHLCPSRSEGWGHYIVEALSCGAVVVTTDAPPMNELVTAAEGVPVAWARSEPRHLGTAYHVDRGALERAIAALVAADPGNKADMGRQARRRYESIRGDFERLIADLDLEALGARGPS